MLSFSWREGKGGRGGGGGPYTLHAVFLWFGTLLHVCTHPSLGSELHVHVGVGRTRGCLPTPRVATMVMG